MINTWQMRSSVVGIVFLLMLTYLLSCTPLSQEEKDFRTAKNEDWYSAYENYIKKYPNEANAQKAKERLVWLRSQKAELKIEHPKVVEMQNGYHNLRGPVWIWDIVFKETGGKIGFKISTSGPRIDDIHGRSWTGNGSGPFNVSPGGTKKESGWKINSPDHELCNATYTRQWLGEDAGGHFIEFYEIVKMSHEGCFRLKK